MSTIFSKEKEVIKANRWAAEQLEKSKQELEFSRYKQDCRKRALELAEKTVCESRKNGTFSNGMKEETGKIIPKEVAEEMLLIGLADKYYNWLINIPEK
jgi:hypothetical protein